MLGMFVAFGILKTLLDQETFLIHSLTTSSFFARM